MSNNKNQSNSTVVLLLIAYLSERHWTSPRRLPNSAVYDVQPLLAPYRELWNCRARSVPGSRRLESLKWALSPRPRMLGTTNFNDAFASLSSVVLMSKLFHRNSSISEFFHGSWSSSCTLILISRCSSSLSASLSNVRST